MARIIAGEGSLIESLGISEERAEQLTNALREGMEAEGITTYTGLAAHVSEKENTNDNENFYLGIRVGDMIHAQRMMEGMARMSEMMASMGEGEGEGEEATAEATAE